MDSADRIEAGKPTGLLDDGMCDDHGKFGCPKCIAAFTPPSGLAGELAELLAKATPGDLKTAEASVVDAGEYAECPLCCGEGEVEQDAHYNNFDAVALGVQFYGIGPHFGAHEKLWSWVMKHRQDILAALTADKARDEADKKPDYETAWRELHEKLSWMQGNPKLGAYLGMNFADVANDLIDKAYPGLRDAGN